MLCMQLCLDHLYSRETKRRERSSNNIQKNTLAIRADYLHKHVISLYACIFVWCLWVFCAFLEAYSKSVCDFETDLYDFVK